MYINIASKNIILIIKKLKFMGNLKRSQELEKFLVANRIRLTERKGRVLLIEPKLGSENPVDEITDVISMLADSNKGFINTATGITPVPVNGKGTQFKGVVSYIIVPPELLSGLTKLFLSMKAEEQE